jgi:LmbE family N-acetylglucosaminyl deacetylase
MGNMNTHRILIILAYPGDESFFMGGTIARYAKDGAEITLICIALGEELPGVELMEQASIYEKELMAAGSVLGIQTVQFLRYPNGSLATTNSENLVSSLVNAMRRIRPDVVITLGQDDPGDTDPINVSNLVTTAFDRSYLKSFVPLTSRLYYVASPDAVQYHDAAVSRGIAVAPLLRIDITSERLTKARAMQCHESQLSPFKRDVEQAAEDLRMYEGFILTRPTGTYQDMTDLFSSLIETL